MADSGAMYALTQLQAEVEKSRAAIAALQDAYGTLRRVAGVFYDAGVEDALGGKRHRSRHLHSVDE